MGITGDGRIHLAYDHHVDRFRYLTTDAGVATGAGGQWNRAIFRNERSSLNENGSSIPRVTFPRFENIGKDLVLTYRDFGSGKNGDVRIATYNLSTGNWSGTRFVNEGRLGSGTYNDATDRRNAYHNGFHADSTGRLHTTWTWREGTQNGNHSINYAYSDDKGVTWRNNDGVLVGTNGSPVTINSPGVTIANLDRRQAILNQQGQIVDSQGGVHALMFHRRQEPGFERQIGDSDFHHDDSAFHHYYRDPLTGQWTVSLLPTDTPVGSRPRIGVDSEGNLFALYTQSDDRVIAGAPRTAAGYADWEILLRDDSRRYEGTPLIDNERLLEEGILSVFLQDRAPTRSETEATGSALRVLEFTINSPLPPFPNQTRC